MKPTFMEGAAASEANGHASNKRAAIAGSRRLRIGIRPLRNTERQVNAWGRGPDVAVLASAEAVSAGN